MKDENIQYKKLININIINEDNEYPIKLEFVKLNECIVIHSNSILSFYEIINDNNNVNDNVNDNINEMWKLIKKVNLKEKIGNFYTYSVKYIKESEMYRFVTISISNIKKPNKILIFDLKLNKDGEILLNIIKEYECNGIPYIASLIGDENLNYSNCCILTNREIKEEIKREIKEEIKKEINGKEFLYKWKQNDERIIIELDIIFQNIDKNLIKCEFKPDEVELTFKEKNKIEKLKLFNLIVPEMSKCIINDDLKLEIIMIKKDKNIWNEIFEKNSKILFDNFLENILKTINESLVDLSSLDKYTSDNPNEEGKKNECITSNYLNNEAENNNEYNSDGFIEFYCIDIFSKNKIDTQKICTNSSELLFMYELSNEINFCLNLLNDGVIWNLKILNKIPIITHKSTFHAFSYISATKKDTVFRFIDNNEKVVLIIDCNGHIFIYENPNKDIKPSQSSYNIQEKPLGITIINDKIIILTKTKLLILSFNM